jgi:asparagine synthase (glutamine-hydrolysing)
VDPLDSPYEGVRAVAPGHCVTIRPDRITDQVCWRAEAADVIRYRRDADYEEHFRQVFREAVANRLVSPDTVWAELSGGLDSSSIVCVAHEVLRRTGMPAGAQSGAQCGAPAGPTTITYLVPARAPADERPYVASVEQQVGGAAHHLIEEDYAPFFPRALETMFLAAPVTSIGRHLAVAALMQARGGTLLLSGHGGDHVMWSSTYACPELADLLAAGRLVRLHRAVRQHGTAASFRTYWNLLWHEAIRPLLPTRLQARRTVPAWILGQRARLERAAPWSSDRSPTSMPPSTRLALTGLSYAIGICSFHQLRICGGVDVSYPYLDRRVVQFMLAVPFDQKLRPGVTRWLHRSALEGLLPPAIRSRTTKASGLGHLCRSVNREWERLQGLFGPDARVVQRGLVSLSGLREALLRAKRGLDVVDALELTRAIALEIWLRNWETNRPHVLRRDGETTVTGAVPALLATGPL